MTTLVLPGRDETPWPSLGGQICDFIEDRAVFGPGSLKGKPAKLDDEKRAAVWKMYELYPLGHELAGRRRFKRVRFSWRKGAAKTEFAAWIAYCELHPEGPVRFDGWDANGDPVGRPVTDPYIPMLAHTQEQVEELAYGALKMVVELGPDADFFDSGLERIIRLDDYGRPDGRAVPLAGSPESRDGARTTFQHYDETHRLHSDRAREAYETMEANLAKRPIDDPWSLGTTTAGRPGQGSIAELDKDEASLIQQGKIETPQLLYFHREASDQHDLKTLQGRIDAVREATGPVGEYAPGQFRDIAMMWDRPKADKAYLERVWLNRWSQAGNQCFDKNAWDEGSVEALATGKKSPPDGAMITLGFDGARYRDMCALIGTEVETGFQWPVAMWDPRDYEDGINPDEVDAAVDDAQKRWKVLRTYGDPAMGWDTNLARWSGKYGPKKITFFYTDARNLRQTANMCRAYAFAIGSGQVPNDGDETFALHIGNAYKRNTKMVDDDDVPLWVMSKQRPDSPDRIDLAMAGGLSWQARLDAIKAGEHKVKTNYVWRD